MENQEKKYPGKENYIFKLLIAHMQLGDQELHISI